MIINNKIIILLFVLLNCCCFVFVKSESKILKNYVESPDSNYRWTLNATYDYDFAKLYVLELVSQEWMKGHSNSSIWKHHLTICIPNNYNKNEINGLLYILDGYNQNWNIPKLESFSNFSKDICKETNAITSSLYQVPNQYIIFENDGIPRDEDDIVAYSWRKYIDTLNSNWVSLLPQTKSASVAMTAIQEFGKQNQYYNLEKFIVLGASKRGWTTFGISMIQDKRLAAIIPMVIGVPNLVESIKLQWASYGNWSWALYSYVNQNIPSFFDTKYFKIITDIVDPINYLNQIESIPKFIILTIEDEFFIPDSTKLWYKQIKGEKRLGLYQSNHAVTPYPGVSKEVSKYFKLISTNQIRPELDWDIQYSNDNQSGTINMKVLNGIPTRVVVYSTNTLSKSLRDFRRFTCLSPTCYQNFTYTTHSIELSSNNSYSFTLSKPATGGWCAFYFEVEFSDIANVNTELAIVPNIYPFPNGCPKDVCASGVPDYIINSSIKLNIILNNLIYLIIILILII